jgi:hypothetical protein|nr:hypothetical protein [uncultured Caldimonas sp.]
MALNGTTGNVNNTLDNAHKNFESSMNKVQEVSMAVGLIGATTQTIGGVSSAFSNAGSAVKHAFEGASKAN